MIFFQTKRLCNDGVYSAILLLLIFGKVIKVQFLCSGSNDCIVAVLAKSGEMEIEQALPYEEIYLRCVTFGSAD